MFEVCRGCGCSNFSSCPGGCWWVDDDLCSSCAVAVDVESGTPLTADEIGQAGWTTTESGIVVPG